MGLKAEDYQYSPGEKVCSVCGGHVYWHGLEGHWVFACPCQGGSYGMYGLQRNEAKPIDKQVYSKNWDRDDD
jgi:hypothetical protein